MLFHHFFFRYLFREGRKVLKFRRLKKWHTRQVVKFFEHIDIDKTYTKGKKQEGLVVSLTVKPGREDQLYLVIKSLLLQKVLPEKIVLWIAVDEMRKADLPSTLLDLQNDIFEIDVTEENLRPYNKILPALKKYPDELIITADDDILYPPWWTKYLMDHHVKYPDEIICYRAYNMAWDGQELLSYNDWPFCNSEESSINYFPTGVSGILYFPGCFTSEVLNSEAISNHSPTADDVWLKIQSILNSIKIRQVECYSQHFPMIPGSQGSALQKTNKHTNDKQLSALMKYYKLSYSDFQDH